MDYHWVFEYQLKWLEIIFEFLVMQWANMTDLELPKHFIQVSLRWFEITLGQLLHVTKEHISQF